MSAFRLTLLGIVIGCTLSGPACAQWKWRDAGGRVQYSDLPPPPGTPDVQIMQRPASASRKGAGAGTPVAAAAAAASAASAPLLPASKTVEPELEAKRRAAEKEKADKLKADEGKQATARADNCTRAKSHLRALDDGMRIARVNDKGEREFLDDKSRAEEAARTRATISADCR